MRRTISTSLRTSTGSVTLVWLLLIAGIAAQIISIPPLWSHRSEGDVLLFGVYTPRYALLLVVSVMVLLGWGLLAWLAWWDRARLLWLARFTFLPAGVALFSPLLPFEPHIKQWIAANGILIALLGVVLNTESEPQADYGRFINRTLMVILIFLIPLMVLTTLTRQPFSPDEAHWADYATTPYIDPQLSGSPSGVYARTWLMTPTPIAPGIGWSVPVYGWFLEHVAFDIRVGRLWNVGFYLLAFAAIGALACRLYGRRAALYAVGFAALSQNFIPIFEYRPSQQLAFAGTFVALLAVNAHQTNRRNARWWHLAAGLAAALSMQLHAAGIAFVVGLGLVYAAELGWSIVRRQPVNLNGGIAFGIGIGIGGAIYYAANIAPVGGLSVFLDTLTSERGTRLTWFGFASWASLAEGLLIAISLAVLALRRAPADRQMLLILGGFAAALAVLDTQGYRAPLAGLYAVAVGSFLANRLPFSQQRSRLAAGWVFTFMAVAAVAFIDWGGIGTWARTGAPPPYLYDELREPLHDWVTDNDIIVGSHLLIWTLPRHPHLYSYAGEVTAMREWGISDPQAVWARVQPTVVIDVERQMMLTDGLNAEMEARGFGVCHRVEIQGIKVTLYRPGCDDDNSMSMIESRRVE